MTPTSKNKLPHTLPSSEAVGFCFTVVAEEMETTSWEWEA